MSKTVLLSVVYPGVEPYFKEFLRSLSVQTNQDFSLLLLNDKFVHLEKFLSGTSLNVSVMEGVGTPAALRIKAISKAISALAEHIVFMDADDYCAVNRLEVIKHKLKRLILCAMSWY